MAASFEYAFRHVEAMSRLTAEQKQLKSEVLQLRASQEEAVVREHEEDARTSTKPANLANEREATIAAMIAEINARFNSSEVTLREAGRAQANAHVAQYERLEAERLSKTVQLEQSRDDFRVSLYSLYFTASASTQSLTQLLGAVLWSPLQ